MFVYSGISRAPPSSGRRILLFIALSVAKCKQMNLGDLCTQGQLVTKWHFSPPNIYCVRKPVLLTDAK